jgi:hypothetical protein
VIVRLSVRFDDFKRAPDFGRTEKVVRNREHVSLGFGMLKRQLTVVASTLENRGFPPWLREKGFPSRSETRIAEGESDLRRGR